MNRKLSLLALLVFTSSFLLSACMGLIPLEKEPAKSDFGPKASPQEQQTRTFEALWADLEKDYIYSETANVNWEALHKKYLERIQAGLTPEEFVSSIKELESELPAGSLRYQSRAERIKSETTDSVDAGIGAFVGFSEDPKPHIVLLDVIKGSPAEQAGLKAHDSIFEIDGSPILLEEGVNAVDRVRGPAGSTVSLEVQSPGRPQRSVAVKRGQFAITGKLEARNLTGTKYGYLFFPPVGYATLANDVTQALQMFAKDQQLEGLVLDLRIAKSTGGWPLEDLYGMFDSGALGEFYNRSAKQAVTAKAQDISGSQKVPLVILVGQNTSGFPEVLAGSLQLHKRAAVIGETTPGAVEATSAFYLPDGSQAFIESASFRLLPGGRELGNTGVIPDLPMQNSWDQILPNQDPVLDRAVQYLEGQK
ncbi:MAG TPA: S41 family peptidase [Anaerolineales bacterium]|nr:S41 family peptidase [Anaerolineales bacterium]